MAGDSSASEEHIEVMQSQGVRRGRTGADTRNGCPRFPCGKVDLPDDGLSGGREKQLDKQWRLF